MIDLSTRYTCLRWKDFFLLLMTDQLLFMSDELWYVNVIYCPLKL